MLRLTGEALGLGLGGATAFPPPAPPPHLARETAAALDSSKTFSGRARTPHDASIPCLADCQAGTAGDPGGAEPAASATPPAAVRAGGDIRAPLKLRHVAPAYPDLARIARIEGDVVLECTISPEGRVVDIRVLSGPPLL